MYVLLSRLLTMATTKLGLALALLLLKMSINTACPSPLFLAILFVLCALFILPSSSLVCHASLLVGLVSFALFSLITAFLWSEAMTICLAGTDPDCSKHCQFLMIHRLQVAILSLHMHVYLASPFNACITHTILECSSGKYSLPFAKISKLILHISFEV
jgi:hypothetical protein